MEENRTSPGGSKENAKEQASELRKELREDVKSILRNLDEIRAQLVFSQELSEADSGRLQLLLDIHQVYDHSSLSLFIQLNRCCLTFRFKWKYLKTMFSTLPFKCLR